MIIAMSLEVRRSLGAAMRYGLRGLCEVATSSPMAHMPPLQQLAAVGRWGHGGRPRGAALGVTAAGGGMMRWMRGYNMY